MAAKSTTHTHPIPTQQPNPASSSHPLNRTLATIATTPNQPQTIAKPPPTNQYTSHHTVPGLRFPPSPYFKEWRGRCFRCCQTGHTVATCKNLTKCGRCWGDGHIGQRCKKIRQQPPKPRRLESKVNTMVEPSFDELLEGAFPYTPRQLPVNRPAKAYCYIARTDEHFKKIERLKRAIVLYAPDIEVDLSINQIAEYAAMTGLTTVQDVSIGILTRSIYLIHLPPDIEPIRFIKAIPDSVWDKGYSFWQWSPAMDSTICNPKYKVLLNIDGSKESDIASAIGTFGIYLGTLEQSTTGDVACATVAVAVTELENIPFQVELVIKGWKTPVEVRAKTWLLIPLYKNEEIPQMSEIFKKTARAISSGEDSNTTEEGNTVSMTRRAIIDLCKGRDFDSLPPEVQEVVTGEKTKEVLPHNTETTRIEGTNDPEMVIVEANIQGG